MRPAIAVGAGLISAALLTLALSGWQLPSDSWRTPLVAGAVAFGLLATWAAFASRRRDADRVDGTEIELRAIQSASPSATQNVAGRDLHQHIYSGPGQPTPSGPRAEVELRAIPHAIEPWACWFHVLASTTTDAIANNARVSVAHRGATVGPEIWQWAGGDKTTQLRRTGTRIPLVVGGLRQSNTPLSVGWFIQPGQWHLTPLAQSAIGRHLTFFASGARNVFDVTVSWEEDGVERHETQPFELRFWKRIATHPRFIRFGDRPSHIDQAGGLTEQRDDGIDLRNEGQAAPNYMVSQWIDRVTLWQDETASIIGEVSTTDANFFSTVNVFSPASFEGVMTPQHRATLQKLHEQIVRLEKYMRAGSL